MAHTIQMLEGAKARVTFQVSAEQTARTYQEFVKEYAQNIEIKGFRKGKAPIDLLERRFGKEFRAETFQNILKEETGETLKTLEPAPLAYSQPYLCDREGEELQEEEAGRLIDSFQPGETLEFAVAYDIAPEIPIASLDGLEFEAVQGTVSEEDVMQELEKLREQNGVMVERKDEAGEDADIVSLQFSLQEAEDGELQEPEKLRTIVRIGETDAHGFHNAVKGLKGGESKTLEKHYFPDEPRVEEDLRGKTARVLLNVTSIRTRELPELDDDFAQDIDEKYETLQDLKEATHKKLLHDAEHLTENYGLLQIYRHWAQNLNFSIPRSMAAYQLQNVMNDIKQRMGGSDQGLGMYLAMEHGGDPQVGYRAMEKESLLGLFVDLVRDKLLQSKRWQASEEDLEKELAAMARHQNIAEEEIKERYGWDKLKEYLAQTALSSKLSKELVGEAGKIASISQSVAIAELKKRRGELEDSCKDLIHDKFSPFPEAE